MEAKEQVRQWWIYKITNPTGRIYIGKTANYNKRIGNYKRKDAKSQVALFNSISKYGFDSHEIEVIDNFSSNSTYASGKEIFWIRSFMSNLRQFPKQKGMNLTMGGEGALGLLVTQMQRDRQSKIMKEKNRVFTDEWRKNQSDFMKGKRYSLGTKYPQEFRDSVSKRMKGSKPSEEHLKKQRDGIMKKLGKPIIHFNINGDFIKEYDSTITASKELGINKNSIRAVLLYGRESTKGMIFKYKYKQNVV